MKQFALIFRMDILTEELQPDAELMALYMEQWNEWINEISAAGRLCEGGNHLSLSGRLILPGGVIKNHPYSAHKESVSGYILILADDLDDAVKIAERCPILEGEGTSVEVRETDTPGK